MINHPTRNENMTASCHTPPQRRRPGSGVFTRTEYYLFFSKKGFIIIIGLWKRRIIQAFQIWNRWSSTENHIS